jgi:hypothetical protein
MQEEDHSDNASLANRTPWHWNKDPALHRLDQWNSLMNGVRPAFDAPRLFSSNFPLFQVGKLPQMVYRIQISNLNKPSTNAFHDLSTSRKAATPVSFPFEQVAWVQSIGSKLK